MMTDDDKQRNGTSIEISEDNKMCEAGGATEKSQPSENKPNIGVTKDNAEEEIKFSEGDQSNSLRTSNLQRQNNNSLKVKEEVEPKPRDYNLIMYKGELEEIKDEQAIEEINKINLKYRYVPDFFNAASHHFPFTQGIINGYIRALVAIESIGAKFSAEITDEGCLLSTRENFDKFFAIFCSVKAASAMIGDFNDAGYDDNFYKITLKNFFSRGKDYRKNEFYLPLYNADIGWYMIVIQREDKIIQLIAPCENSENVDINKVTKHVTKFCNENYCSTEDDMEGKVFTVKRSKDEFLCNILNTGVSILLSFLKQTGFQNSLLQTVMKLAAPKAPGVNKYYYTLILARKMFITKITENKFNIRMLFRR